MKQRTMPNPENATAQEVHAAMKSAPTITIGERLMIIYLLLKGTSKKKIIRLRFCKKRTLNNLIKRFNEMGIDGLYDKKGRGRKAKLDKEEREKLGRVIEDPNSAGEFFWTGVKLHGYLKKEWGKEISYPTVMRTLGDMNYVFKVPRSWPMQQDEELRQEFKKKMEELMRDNKNEIWFSDETGIEGDPRPRRRLAKKGEECLQRYLGKHLRDSVIGGVCPSTGEFVSVVMPYVNTDVFQMFLDEVNKVIQGREIIMVMDNASWHKPKRLNWGSIKVMYLPPYSPDLNPIERLWLVLKARFFPGWTAKTQEELTNRVVFALRYFLDSPEETKSICSLGNYF